MGDGLGLHNGFRVRRQGRLLMTVSESCPGQNALSVALGWSYPEGGGRPGSGLLPLAEDPVVTPRVPGSLRDQKSERPDL